MKTIQKICLNLLKIKKNSIIFLFQNDRYLIREVGFSENDIIRLNLNFRNILIEQHENNYILLKIQKKVFLRSF